MSNFNCSTSCMFNLIADVSEFISEDFLYFTELDYKFFEIYPFENNDVFNMLDNFSNNIKLKLFNFSNQLDFLYIKEFLAKSLSKHLMDEIYFINTDGIIYITDGVDNFKVNADDITRILKYTLHESPYLVNKIPEYVLKNITYNPTFKPEFDKYFNATTCYIKDATDEIFNKKYTQESKLFYYDYSKRIFSHRNILNENLELKYWVIENSEKLFNIKPDELIAPKEKIFSYVTETRPSERVNYLIENYGRDKLIEMYREDIKHRDFIKDYCTYENSVDKFNSMEYINFYYPVNCIDENALMNVEGIKLFEIPNGTKWVKELYLNKHMSADGILKIPSSVRCFEMKEIPNFKIECDNKESFKKALLNGGCSYMTAVEIVKDCIQTKKIDFSNKYNVDYL